MNKIHYAVFSDMFLWEGLNEEEISEIYNMLPQEVIIKRGNILYSEKHFKRALALILSGNVIITMGEKSEKPTLMRKMQSGDVFGAASIFCNAESYVSVISAKTDVSVIFIPEDTLKKIFTLFPAVSLNYISFLSSRIRFLNQRISSFAGKSVKEKVFSYISAMAQTDYEVQIKKISEMARVLSIGRTSLYRALDELKADGRIIEKTGKYFVDIE